MKVTKKLPYSTNINIPYQPINQTKNTFTLLT